MPLKGFYPAGHGLLPGAIHTVLIIPNMIYISVVAKVGAVFHVSAFALID